MRSQEIYRPARLLIVAMVMMAVLSAPAMAGNTCTAYGVILEPLEARFSADPFAGSAPLTVQFTDESTGEITAWAWDFDNDGTIDSTDQNPLHTYTAAGTYTVKLTVTGPGGSDEEVKTDYITVREPGVLDIYWVASKPMDVEPGGTVEFRV
jgi:PKD repeat protein